MSEFDEDIFFDEDEKETQQGNVISEDDFDETEPALAKEKNTSYESIREIEDDEFRDDFDIIDEDEDDYEEEPVEIEIEIRAAEDMSKEEEEKEDASEDTEDDFVEEDGESDEPDDEDDKEYEDVCFVCRRPESVTGKQFKLPNNICVCNDCMHKTMDAVSQFDYQGMLDPSMMDQVMYGMDLNELSSKFPNISFVNLADLQGDGGIPNKQKLKKKKKKDKKKKR